jgi:chromosome transmission fidelity protein 4
MSQVKLHTTAVKGWTLARFTSKDGAFIMTSDNSPKIKVVDKYGEVAKSDHNKHEEGVNDIAIMNTFVVSASSDRSARLWSIDDGALEGGDQFDRIESKIYSVAGSGDTNFVACGTDRSIRLLDRRDMSYLRSIKGHEGFITSLAFDPLRDYLASASTDGTLKIWKYTADDALMTTLYIASKDNSLSQRNRMAWSKNGDYLAVATDKGVAIIARDTWQIQYTIEEPSKVLDVAWSASGEYLASAHEKSVFIWSKSPEGWTSTNRVEVASVCSIEWHPKNQTTILVSNLGGQWGLVENVIFESKRSKKTNIENPLEEVQKQSASLKALLADEAEESDDDILERALEEDKSDRGSVSRKNSSKKRFIDDTSSIINEDMEMDENDLEVASVASNRSAHKNVMPASKAKVPKEPKQAVTIIQGYTPEIQTAFQPNASSVEEKRRYLAWNTTGSVVARYDDASTNIEVEFSDQSAHKNFSMNKGIKITQAALGNKAAVLASDGKDGNASSILYCQFESWAHNSDWTIKLEQPEQVEAVAVGDEWIAIATSSRFLRIFTTSGIQRAVLSVAGDVVSMVGQQRKLAVVFSATPNLPGDQNLNYMILDVQKQLTLSEGLLPLSRKSRLEWIGFSDEEHMLCSFDSFGILRALVSPTSQGEWGKQWSPICETENNGKGTRVWPIGIVHDKLIYIPKPESSVAPLVLPRPTPTTLQLQIPVLNVNKKEEEYMRESIRYFHLKHEAIDKCIDGASWKTDSDLLDEQVKLDKLMTEILAAAASGDKLERAYDAASLMMLRRSLSIGLAVAQRLNHGALAQKIQNLSDQHGRFMHDVVPSSSSASNVEDDSDARPTKRQRTSMDTHKVTAVDSEQESDDESAESEQSSSVKENERNATNILNSLPVAKPADKKQPAATVKANPFAKLTAQPAPTSGSLFSTINSLKSSPANNKKRKLFN